MSEAEKRLTNYVARRERLAATGPTTRADGTTAPVALEREKFSYVRDRLKEMLESSDGYSEADWQRTVANLFLLLYPQYVAVLDNVRVKEQYSNESKLTSRYIDLMLVGANGCVDIIEIKRPFERGLVTKRRYRDNHIPVRELAGSIMQAEKYLFFLSKSGRAGERDIMNRNSSKLPQGLEIKIANPKAFILAGRDYNLSLEERFDLEFVRRKYSNMMDIVSYDDLLRRVNNIVAALDERSRHDGGSTPTYDPKDDDR